MDIAGNIVLQIIIFTIITLIAESIISDRKRKLKKLNLTSKIFYKDRAGNIFVNLIGLLLFTIAVYLFSYNANLTLRLRFFFFSGLFYNFMLLIHYLYNIHKKYDMIIIENENELKVRDEKKRSELINEKRWKELEKKSKERHKKEELKNNAISALIHLGWKKKASEEKINQILNENSNIKSIDELVKLALKK